MIAWSCIENAKWREKEKHTHEYKNLGWNFSVWQVAGRELRWWSRDTRRVSDSSCCDTSSLGGQPGRLRKAMMLL